MKKILYILTLLLLGVFTVYCLENQPHDFARDECLLCHQMGVDGNILSSSLKSTGCNPCHPDLTDNAYMHPVDIRPSTVAIASGFPLSENGMVTCNTCHDVHALATTPMGNPSFFLRRFERGKMFCDLCHYDSGPTDNSHRAVLGEAHFMSKNFDGSTMMEIDPMSKNCLSCHDGSLGSSITLNTGLWQHQNSLLNHENGGSHQIGIDYEAVRIKRLPRTDLRPISMVDQRLKFFDGKMGCGTCHNPYSTDYKDLVMTDRKSALCFACHAYDGRK